MVYVCAAQHVCKSSWAEGDGSLMAILFVMWNPWPTGITQHMRRQEHITPPKQNLGVHVADYDHVRAWN